MSEDVECYLGGVDRKFQDIVLFVKLGGWNTGFPLLFYFTYILINIISYILNI